MGVNFIKLSEPRKSSATNLGELNAHLSQLVCEPFRFVRVSYGDELTLHFGHLGFYQNPPKLKDKPHGDFILGMRASPWVLKTGSGVLLSSGGQGDWSPESNPELGSRDLESKRLIEPESLVSTAKAFPITPANRLGLRIRFADGTSLLVLPDAEEPDDPEDHDLPVLADWELLSPSGSLQAGPGFEWSFDPKSIVSPAPHSNPVAIPNQFSGVRTGRGVELEP